MGKRITRKEFFKESTKYVAGMSAGIIGLNLLSAQKAQASGQFSWPWPYTTLDPEYVRVLGHDAFWSGKGCSYGAFQAIIQALQEALGDPYTAFPTEMMTYGHGGTVGWGTLCGALNGSAAAISLICTKEESDQLVNELVGWYTQTDFPTDVSNQYAVNHQFGVNNYDQPLAQNQSGSPLCHVSITEWCYTSNFKVHDVERKERCARLTGDVAAYAVKILNDYFSGQFTPIYDPPASIAACMTCHGTSGEDKVAAKMECMQCHGDPHAPTEIKNPEPLPSHYMVKQNYPNPFNPNTTIEFSLPETERVSISIYDLYGRLVKTLISNREYAPGTYSIRWDGTNNMGMRAGSGMYFYRFKAGSFERTMRMTLVK